MSHEDVQRFLNDLESDAALQNQARAIDAADGQAAAEALVRLGADRGYSFTAPELAQALHRGEGHQRREGAEATGEMGVEQLERVAGGVLIGLLLPAVQKVRCDGSVKFISDNITDGTSNTLL
jgi:predicted ribosomally synthesized peptide with nif11-like leader